MQFKNTPQHDIFVTTPLTNKMSGVRKMNKIKLFKRSYIKQGDMILLSNCTIFTKYQIIINKRKYKRALDIHLYDSRCGAVG